MFYFLESSEISLFFALVGFHRSSSSIDRRKRIVRFGLSKGVSGESKTVEADQCCSENLNSIQMKTSHGRAHF
ncbi:hypothetical protein T07_1756 [Trichinella nelsoni]|uniref:Uncharacterized protein n=1 Tax=Trichinella nelsoni TaxID=6336 RepID=A0A0V0SBF7_9BILA|nr:hypothetical protein T07_1756 [Trichinella nelsoni]